MRFTTKLFGAILILGIIAAGSFSCTKSSDAKITSNDSIVVALTPDEWDYFAIASERYYTPAPGVFEFTSEGVKGYAEAYRLGGYLVTRKTYELKDRDIYIKWKANDGGAFGSFAAAITYSAYIYGPYTGMRNFTQFNFCSSPTSWNGSTIISNDTWYYTKTSMGSNRIFQTSTCTGNYIDYGGTQIESYTDTALSTHGHVSLFAGDCYAGPNSYVVLGELKIK